MLKMNCTSRICWNILFFVHLSTCALAQVSAGDRWLIQELSKFSDENISVFSRYPDSGKPLLPPDVPPESGTSDSHRDHLLLFKGSILLAVDGTGRLYELKSMGDQLSFNRLDQTVFSGYNFGAAVFSLNDSIFSLGGYGFWNFNGQLRCFNPISGSWQVLPVNKKIPAIVNGSWLDRSTHRLYFLENFVLPADEAIKPTSDFFSKKANRMEYVWQLDLARRQWVCSGLLNTSLGEARQTLYISKAGDLPQGELFTGNEKTFPRGLILNYATNKSYEFRSAAVHDSIRYMVSPEFNLTNHPEKIISFYTLKDSSLHILRSDSMHRTFRLRQKDFRELAIPVFQPLPEDDDTPISSWPWIYFCLAGIAFLGIGLALVFQARKILQKGGIKDSAPATFTASEIQVLDKFNNVAEAAATTDDLDAWLGNSSKSADLRTKARSLFIRGINQKYSLVTGDPEGLIQAERLDSDRRMVRYRFDREKFARLMTDPRHRGG